MEQIQVPNFIRSNKFFDDSSHIHIKSLHNFNKRVREESLFNQSLILEPSHACHLKLDPKIECIDINLLIGKTKTNSPYSL